MTLQESYLNGFDGVSGGHLYSSPMEMAERVGAWAARHGLPRTAKIAPSRGYRWKLTFPNTMGFRHIGSAAPKTATFIISEQQYRQ